MQPLTATRSPQERRRIGQTIAVRDTDRLSKVGDAGIVYRTASGELVQVMHDGTLVHAGGYHGGWMADVISALRGHHEPQEEIVLAAIVDRLRADGAEAHTTVELGAFWAYYSLWLARGLPGVRSVMVEPDAENLDLGRRNFALNGLDGEFVPAAVGTHGAVSPLLWESDGAEHEVKRVSVDGLVADRGLDRIDVLHCDTQGAELEALEGARGTVADGRVRFVVVSTHHESISGDPAIHDRCLTWLLDAGAHVVAEHDVFSSCSGDGLIAATFEPRDRRFSVAIPRVSRENSLFG